MELLNAKIIPTHQGLETYLDIPNNITITELRTPTKEKPYLDIKFGIEYYRLKQKHYYDSQINYFWMRIYPEFSSISLLETDIQNIFSVKDQSERQATKELIGEWLINTKAFKQTILQLIEDKRKENVSSREEIRQIDREINLLEKVLELRTEDILKASVQKYN
ncbi:hypothetical protein WQ57_10070 [Mesobacillus campisalis]|uniref:Uncharacterized protein n=1 Tax=Mesobacillus campisalis TaxID=1408103 RepID=A0A0M2SYU4_9BACI|nr:hypothetical protein [Mesobacillus campisalis]KKK38152.1 hypothetical protein WQ57_10070 [Mesobacillus campisalis]